MSTFESIDPYKFLQGALNPDDSLTRHLHGPRISPISDPNLPVLVITKDLTISQSNNTWVRLFLAHEALGHPSNKLPLIIYFHGSGFILCSVASTIVHDFYSKIAENIQAVVASVEYCHAPEHRQSAAFDDVVEELHWIKTRPDDWLREFTDYSNCYIMGSSEGAIIAYHVGLRVVEEGVKNNLEPMKIRGLILRQPAFEGTQGSESLVMLMNTVFYLDPFKK